MIPDNPTPSATPTPRFSQMTTLYKITTPDFLDDGGAFGVEAVPVESLYGPSGYLQHSSSNLYPSEVAALSVLGLKLAVESESQRRRLEIQLEALEGIREKLRVAAGEEPYVETLCNTLD